MCLLMGEPERARRTLEAWRSRVGLPVGNGAPFGSYWLLESQSSLEMIHPVSERGSRPRWVRTRHVACEPFRPREYRYRTDGSREAHPHPHGARPPASSAWGPTRPHAHPASGDEDVRFENFHIRYESTRGAGGTGRLYTLSTYADRNDRRRSPPELRDEQPMLSGSPRPSRSSHRAINSSNRAVLCVAASEELPEIQIFDRAVGWRHHCVGRRLQDGGAGARSGCHDAPGDFIDRG